MLNPPSNDKVIDNPVKDGGPVKALLRLTETAALFRSTDGCFYAQVSVGGRREIFTLRSRAFRDWLIDGYFRAFQEIPSDWSMRRVLAKLEATARFAGGTPSIFVRVGHDGNGKGEGSACYLDLADPGGQAVRIDPDGWSVVNNPDVHFRRPVGHLPLPIPSREGSIDVLRSYVNLTDRDFRLLIVWMAAAIRPFGPYPILGVYGLTGAAKTSLVKIVRLLVDPQAAAFLAEPRSTRELMVSAVNGWLLAYDNIGVIPNWLSDGLCLLASGGAVAGLAPFTSGERIVIHAQRPVLLAGIDEFAERSDLIDRSVFLDLPPIASNRRRCDRDYWEDFHQDYPRILGGLLDVVVGGLRELPSVKLAELPRMADFAKFAEAVGRNLGWPAQTAVSDYSDNRHEATVSMLENSPLAILLLEITTDRPDWTRTATDLLAELTAIAGRRVAASPLWPKTPLSLSKELRRIAPQMGTHGISIVFERTRDARFITITKINPPTTEASPDVSVSDTERCFDSFIDAEKSVTDVTPMPATT